MPELRTPRSMRMNKKYLKQYHIKERARNVAANILADDPASPVMLYGVPRGGIPAAYAVAGELRAAIRCEVVDSPEAAHYIIDDIIDSGATKDRHDEYGIPFHALFQADGQWLVFPWEGNKDQDSSATDIPTRLLQFIGEDPARGGLVETPKRFLKAWEHYASGYTQSPGDILKVFEDGAEKCDEMVIVRDIPVYSHCEHHLAPFFGVAHIGYIPDGRIVGLSKLSRLVDVFARRLQVQERLTNQIADAMEEHLKPIGVAVTVSCRHMCMEARGIQRQGSSTITSAMRGAMKEKPEARAEFVELIK